MEARHERWTFRAVAATPKVRVADPQYNVQQIMDLIGQGYSRGGKLMVFPELCLTAYTCADLFGQKAPAEKGEGRADRIVRFTDGKDILVFWDFPWERTGSSTMQRQPSKRAGL